MTRTQSAGRAAARRWKPDPTDNRRLANLCGALDVNLRQIESALDVSIRRQQGLFTVKGYAGPTDLAVAALQFFYARATRSLGEDDIALGLISLRDAPPEHTERASRELRHGASGSAGAETGARNLGNARKQTRARTPESRLDEQGPGVAAKGDGEVTAQAPSQALVRVNHKDHGDDSDNEDRGVNGDQGVHGDQGVPGNHGVLGNQGVLGDHGIQVDHDAQGGGRGDGGNAEVPRVQRPHTSSPAPAAPRKRSGAALAGAPLQSSGVPGKPAHARSQAPEERTGGASAPPEAIRLVTRRADLEPRTPNQRLYLQRILSHDISFGTGPAGTGKTYLAVACAVDALERDQVKRIILTRPAVEAGERLGFLPGDLAQKVDPYLRPLYDALYDLMGFDRVNRALERQSIEIAPLAYMRGRTLNHAFIILDEAQNTTPEQIKMFLTRLGFGSRAVVTGDPTQIDLPKGQASGLIAARKILGGVKGLSFTEFDSTDVIRHPLIARIVEAYERQARIDGQID